MKKALILKAFNLIFGPVIILAVLTANVFPAVADEIHVPNNQPTIQAAIDHEKEKRGQIYFLKRMMKRA